MEHPQEVHSGTISLSTQGGHKGTAGPTIDTLEQVEANLARLTIDSELMDRHRCFIDCLEIALVREQVCSGNLMLYVQAILKMAKGSNSPFQPKPGRVYDFKIAKKQLPVLPDAPAFVNTQSMTLTIPHDELGKRMMRSWSSDIDVAASRDYMTATQMPWKITGPSMKKEFDL